MSRSASIISELFNLYWCLDIQAEKPLGVEDRPDH